VECVQLAAAFGSQSSLPIEKQSGSKLHALHMSAQISLSPAKHIPHFSGGLSKTRLKAGLRTGFRNFLHVKISKIAVDNAIARMMKSN
jgi:hypothetical protein